MELPSVVVTITIVVTIPIVISVMISIPIPVAVMIPVITGFFDIAVEIPAIMVDMPAERVDLAIQEAHTVKFVMQPALVAAVGQVDQQNLVTMHIHDIDIDMHTLAMEPPVVIRLCGSEGDDAPEQRYQAQNTRHSNNTIIKRFHDTIPFLDTTNDFFF